MLTTPWAFVKRDCAQAASYKIYFVAQLVDVLFIAAIFYFMGQIFREAAAPALTPYGGNYFAFIFIGVAFTDYLSVSLTAFHTSIRESQMMGTLEILLMTPVKLSTILICSSLWPYLFTSYRFILYLAVGAFLFGLDLGSANLLSTLVVLILSILCFATLGILTASIVMVIKKGGDWSKLFLTGVSVLLGGVAYPVSVLPGWLKSLSAFIPLTHSLNAMRQALLQGRTLADLRPDLLSLGLFSLVLWPLSLWIFQLSVKQTKVTGSLSQY